MKVTSELPPDRLGISPGLYKELNNIPGFDPTVPENIPAIPDATSETAATSPYDESEILKAARQAEAETLAPSFAPNSNIPTPPAARGNVRGNPTMALAKIAVLGTALTLLSVIERSRTRRYAEHLVRDLGAAARAGLQKYRNS